MGGVFAVLVFGVVEDLVFESESVGEAVFDAGVSGFGDFPIELEDEVLVGFFRVDAAGGFRAVEFAVLDHPSFGDGFAFLGGPVVEVFAVEEGFPFGGAGEGKREGGEQEDVDFHRARNVLRRADHSGNQ